MKINRRQFFDLYRKNFGPLTQSLVDALDDLIDFVEADTHFPTSALSRRRLAYILATTRHETAGTYRPIDEFGTDARFEKKYGHTTKKGLELGNVNPGDGALYHGRGYVQITGRNNYRNMGNRLNANMEQEPETAKVVSIAYNAMVIGMTLGMFTGKKLATFINDTRLDFVNARRTVNGTDMAEKIAANARIFDEILLGSVLLT